MTTIPAQRRPMDDGPAVQWWVARRRPGLRAVVLRCRVVRRVLGIVRVVVAEWRRSRQALREAGHAR